MKRLTRILRRMRATRLTWRRPPRGGVLVFDRYASDPITELLAPGSFEVFDNQFEVINVPVLLRTLLHGGRRWYDYCRQFVALAQPRLLVSAIDSNAHVYTFEAVSPSTKVVVIQNGIRGNVAPTPAGDVWSTLQRQFPDVTPSVDLMLTLGEAHSSLYARHVRGSTAAIGSIRNNAFIPAISVGDRGRRRVAFISQYSGLDHCDIFPDGRSPALLTFVDSDGVTAETFHAVDGRVAGSVARWCAAHGHDFTIIGRRTSAFPHERKFFDAWCGGTNHTFVPKGGETLSYEIAHDADLVVCIDSTLGYEMFARGKRVAFVSARGKHIGPTVGADADLRVFRFGYPDVVDPTGPMWTSLDDDDEIRRVVEWALDCDDETWRRATAAIAPRVMTFDPGNARLRAALVERGAVLAQ